MTRPLDSIPPDEDSPVDDDMCSAFWWAVIAAWVFCPVFFYLITTA